MQAFINGVSVSFEQGETILQAARRVGQFIPTLCAFQPLNHTPASCRVCLVDVKLADGQEMLLTACNTPLQEGMVISTRSPKARAAQRKQVELIFADHAQDCAACVRHGNCELQALAAYVGLTTSPAAFKTNRKVDSSATALVRDLKKCVRCMRCVEACRQVQGIAALTLDRDGLESGVGVGGIERWGDSPLCVQCGQCTLVCPTGALGEKDQTETVLNWIDDPETITVFQFAPAVRATLGEEFGMAPGTNVEKEILVALRQLGANFVMDTDFTADVVIMEEGTELLGRITKGGLLPMFTSCCPGWINFVEKHYPELIPHISTTRSPQAVLGALVRTYLVEKKKLDPAKVRSISIMPCIAKKDECARPALAREGVPDVDLVLTVREFARLLRSQGIKLDKLTTESATIDSLMGDSTGAAVIFGTTGGVMEAALRTVYKVLTGEELGGIDIHAVRGMEHVREASIDIPGTGPVRVAICHGLKNVHQLIADALNGTSPYTFIEVMACPGGCIDGGGTPRICGEYLPDARTRQQSLYNIDKEMPVRQSHNNPQVQKLYADFLGEPNSHKAHELLHTSYTNRKTAGQQPSIEGLWKRLER